MILIATNHDLIPNRKFEALGLQVETALEEALFYFTHFPDQQTPKFVFCGHVHPGVTLSDVGKQRLKLPCFFKAPIN